MHSVTAVATQVAAPQIRAIQSAAAPLAGVPSQAGVPPVVAAPAPPVVPAPLVAAVPPAVSSPVSPTSINVRDHGAIADGSSHPLSARFATLTAARAVYPRAESLAQETDLVALQAAVLTGRSLSFGSGHYVLGTITQPGYRIADIPANNLVYSSDGAIFTVNTQNAGESRLFSVNGKSGFRLQGKLTVNETGSNFFPVMVNSQGIVALELLDNWSDVVVDDLHVNGVRGGVQSYRSDGSLAGLGRRGQFKVSARRSYYPFVLAENGDDVTAEVSAEECARPFFIYGVKNFAANITQKNNHPSYTSIIKRYKNNTIGVRVKIVADINIASVRELVSIDHQNNDGAASIIQDVSIAYTINSVAGSGTTGTYAVVNLAHYPLSGSMNTTNLGTYRNIEILGLPGPYPADVNSEFSASATPLNVFRLMPGHGFVFNLATAGAQNINR